MAINPSDLDHLYRGTSGPTPQARPLTPDNPDRNIEAQIDYFSSEGNDAVADVFRGIRNERDSVFNSIQQDLVGQYDALENYLNPRFEDFLSKNREVYDEIMPRIREDEQLVRQQFGPDGELIGQANSYFNNLINAVNQNVSGNIASAANQAQRTGASQSAVNAAIQQARQQGMGDLASVQGEKLAQQQNLYTNLLNMQNALRGEELNVEDQLVREPLLKMYNQASTIGQGLLNSLAGVRTSELQEYLNRLNQERSAQLQRELARASGAGA